ncbi:MAG: glycoside hydrolase family 3 C-terminal domain-containing protein, partial [Firmicutes bacterium]|nr:glycoside hydrolase family 3 C-terminal domain-containing protein [Bacillota bacterium]
ISLPSIDHDDKQLEEDLYPFKHAIKEGIASIMTAHLLLPGLEQQKIPATMSKRVLTGILRETLAFEGLIITDCLEMSAISEHYGVEQGAVMSILAGSDILCISHRPKYQIAAFKAIRQAVADRTIPMQLLDDRVQRILDYKERYKLLSLMKKIHPVKQAVLDKNREFAAALSQKSVTLVRDDKQLLPIKRDDKVVAVSPVRKMFSGVDGTLTSCDFAGLFAHRFDCEYVSFEDAGELTGERLDDLIMKCGQADKVVVGAYNATILQDQQRLLEKISAVNHHIILVALRIPYDASILEKDISTALCTYEYTDESVSALLDAMAGHYQPAGRLPVSLGEDIRQHQ